MSERSVFITSAEAACALGNNLQECLDKWSAGQSGLSVQDGVLAGRIQDTLLIKGRRYGAASNLAVSVARSAVAKAGWNPAALDDVWLFAGSSRGNVGEILDAHAWRRGSRRFRASNTLHSEIAAAVSIELQMKGPWQMISNGCSAGLDALGLAFMALRSGMARRALVVTVDLPVISELVKDFQDTRLLTRVGVNNPLSPQTNGFIPAEGAAAVTLEMGSQSMCEIAIYAANSDAYDSLVVPPEGEQLAALMQAATGNEMPDLICPHATGTANHATGEVAALRRAFGDRVPPLLLLKPFTGHTLGASGLLDVALLSGAMAAGEVPGNLPGLDAPDGIQLPERPSRPRSILKIASGMGGHNAALLLRSTLS